MSDEQEVKELGDRIGYGRMMQLAEQEWRRSVNGGELTVGPCAADLVPCLCPNSAASCPWCCGARRVTERVRRAIVEHSLWGEVIDKAKLWFPTVQTKANHARMTQVELLLWKAIRTLIERSPS